MYNSLAMANMFGRKHKDACFSIFINTSKSIPMVWVKTWFSLAARCRWIPDKRTTLQLLCSSSETVCHCTGTECSTAFIQIRKRHQWMSSVRHLLNNVGWCLEPQLTIHYSTCQHLVASSFVHGNLHIDFRDNDIAGYLASLDVIYTINL